MNNEGPAYVLVLADLSDDQAKEFRSTNAIPAGVKVFTSPIDASVLESVANWFGIPVVDLIRLGLGGG